MRKLDVKEIHGYERAKGLKLLRPDALAEKKGRSAENGRKKARGRIAEKRNLNFRRQGRMFDWFVSTLRSYPEIALFLSLAIGYYVGGFSYKGFSLGAVTSTLIAAVIIGQLGITISPNVKSTFFLMFLFAVG